MHTHTTKDTAALLLSLSKRVALSTPTDSDSINATIIGQWLDMIRINTMFASRQRDDN